MARTLSLLVVEDEDIQAYYEENTADFVTDETVNLQYVELLHEELAAELDIDEDRFESRGQDQRKDDSGLQQYGASRTPADVGFGESAEESKILPHHLGHSGSSPSHGADR